MKATTRSICLIFYLLLFHQQAQGLIPDTYASSWQAAEAATNLFNPISITEDREYMGTIHKTSNGYRFTAEAGRSGANEISIRVPAQNWDKVVAFWHTHGGMNRAHQYFSNVDTHMANRFGKPLYLADYKGLLKLFNPGDPTISPISAGRLGLPPERGFATGSVVRDANNRMVRINTRADSTTS